MTAYPRTGRPFAGGCRDCNAASVPTLVSPTAVALFTQHSEGCPVLAAIVRKLDQEDQS